MNIGRTKDDVTMMRTITNNQVIPREGGYALKELKEVGCPRKGNEVKISMKMDGL